MSQLLKQHLIDPEICIRCYTCEMTCSIGAITHDDQNVVVDAEKCNYCMECIPVCPTGSIDEWRVVKQAFTVDEQLSWDELPEQEELEVSGSGSTGSIEAHDDVVAALLADAHAGAGGKAKAPASAAKPTVNMYTIGKPATATIKGNYRLTHANADTDVRHIILDFGPLPMPVLEGQSIGIIPPGTTDKGEQHLPRLYSISSPRDGERQNFNNLSLTVKNEEVGVCSNYLCGLSKGDTVQVTGPFGATFLLPESREAKLLMICTGTGSAPFRAFTMNKQRGGNAFEHPMKLFFGARTPESLPYCGPLKKVPDSLLEKRFAYSRIVDQPKRYVQDEITDQADELAPLLTDKNLHIYICGLRGMEEGINAAFTDIAKSVDLEWLTLRNTMREDGRYHSETY